MSGRRLIRSIVEIAVVVVVVEVFLLPRYRGQQHDVVRLLTTHSPWLLLAALAEAGSFAAFALATRALLTPAVRPSVGRLMRVDLSTIALSHGVPGGSAAGTALGVRLLCEAGVPLSEAVFAKTAQGVVSAVVLQALTVGCLSAVLLAGSGTALLATAVGVALAFISGIVGAGTALRRHRSSVAAALRASTRRLPFIRDAAVQRLVTSLGELLDELPRDRRRFSTAVCWSVVNWLMDALALWASVRAYGHSLSFLDVMAPFLIASTLGWIPLTPGGLGFVEAAALPLLIAFGTPSVTAALGVLTWRLVAFWLPIPLGAVAYASLRVSRPPERTTDAEGGPLPP